MDAEAKVNEMVTFLEHTEDAVLYVYAVEAEANLDKTRPKWIEAVGTMCLAAEERECVNYLLDVLCSATLWVELQQAFVAISVWSGSTNLNCCLRVLHAELSNWVHAATRATPFQIH